jgi:hypothetical protein
MLKLRPYSYNVGRPVTSTDDRVEHEEPTRHFDWRRQVIEASKDINTMLIYTKNFYHSRDFEYLDEYENLRLFVISRFSLIQGFSESADNLNCTNTI